MKLIGLHQLINPNSKTLFGYSIYKLGGFILILHLLLNIIMCNISIYYSLYDFTAVVKYIMFMSAIFFNIIKISFVIIKSDVLWNFISFTSIKFLPYSGHQRYLLMNARIISIIISNISAILWTAIISIWIFSPIIIQDNYLNIKSKNSTYKYRYNMLNLIFPVSTQFYNDNFKVFYLFETITLMVIGYSMVIFDCFLISFCITIAFQLKMIASSYSALGYNHTNNNQIKSKLSFLHVISCLFYIFFIDKNSKML